MLKRNSVQKVFIAFLILIMVISPDSPCIFAASKSQPKARDIENGSLIIGTHIIFLKAVNEELLAAAKKSAADKSQGKRYYKSEFADGKWFDITNAKDFSDISDLKKPVDDSEIDALTLTHWTGPDGVTIDLLKDAVVFINVDPQNPLSFPELEEIKKYKTIAANTEKSADSGNICNSIDRILSQITVQSEPLSSDNAMQNLKNEKYMQIKIVDEYIGKLSVYIECLKSNNDTKFLSIPKEILDAFFNKKLMLCYEILQLRLSNEIKYAISPGEDISPYVDLSSKYSATLEEINKKIVELGNLATSGIADYVLNPKERTGTSALTEKKRKEEKLLVDYIKSTGLDGKEKDTALKKAKVSLENIYYITQILSGNIDNAEYETTLLKDLYSFEIKKLETDTLWKDIGSLKNIDKNMEDISNYIELRNKDISKKDITKLYKSARSQCAADLKSIGSNKGNQDIYNYLLSMIKKISAFISAKSTVNGKETDKERLEKDIASLKSQYLKQLENRDLENALKTENSIREKSELLQFIEVNAMKGYKDCSKALLKQNQLLADAFNNNAPDIDKILENIDDLNKQLAQNTSSMDDKTKVFLELYTETLSQLEAASLKLENADAVNLAKQLVDIYSNISHELVEYQKDIDALDGKINGKFLALVNSSDFYSAAALYIIQKDVNIILNPDVDENTPTLVSFYEILKKLMGAFLKDNTSGITAEKNNLINFIQKLTSKAISKKSLDEELEKLDFVIRNKKSASYTEVYNTIEQAFRLIAAKGSGIANPDAPAVSLPNAITSLEASLGLKYPADAEQIREEASKKNCLITRIIILDMLEKTKKYDANEIKSLKADYVKKLKNIEANKYTAGELVSINGKGYKMLSPECMVTSGKTDKYQKPLVLKNGNIYISLNAIAALTNARILWKQAQGKVTVTYVKDKSILNFRDGNKLPLFKSSSNLTVSVIDGVAYIPYDEGYIKKVFNVSCRWEKGLDVLIVYENRLDEKISSLFKK